jgi:hypothetical protein
MEQPERTTVARETDRLDHATTSDARRRALVAGCVGNLVEWYDFALYGASATVLAARFFPGADPVSRLPAAFAIFGVAFLARPAGALLRAGQGVAVGGEYGGSAAFVVEYALADRPAGTCSSTRPRASGPSSGSTRPPARRRPTPCGLRAVRSPPSP